MKMIYTSHVTCHISEKKLKEFVLDCNSAYLFLRIFSMVSFISTTSLYYEQGVSIFYECHPLQKISNCKDRELPQHHLEDRDKGITTFMGMKHKLCDMFYFVKVG